MGLQTPFGDAKKTCNLHVMQKDYINIILHCFIHTVFTHMLHIYDQYYYRRRSKFFPEA